ncbi:MAG TPA: PQQ-dependent sugar dehydrogenase [Gemmatimonadaceae bacterium]|nr:PQQ-dependent sugar dehydrogenase [Gemmatimonadaceae bacterium]HRQ77139.1 PQQ-dependent sugar dehydrogenase [Gemmatimonadaceae bacterium]
MLLVTAAAAISGCRRPLDADALALQSPTPDATTGVVTTETVASGLEHPWALDFLPDGRILVSERPGRLRLVATDGTVSEPLGGVPAVQARGQGGLLDVAVDPDFATTQLVYFTYAEPGEGGAGTSAARARLVGDALVDLQVIYRQRPKLEGNGHFGSRIVFARDGKIFITQGDRQSYRDRAQDLAQGMGKIVRIERDGAVPADNPFVGQESAQPEIWSYGHRNLQGATLHPETGALWTVEHGARGGDELNHPEAGKNYGWPVITYGRDYSGLPIGEGTAREGMEQPVYFWDPVIAPSGLAFNTGTRYAGWQGSLFVGSLNPGGLVRLELRDGRVVHEERHLAELRERIRDVVPGPDGYLYLVTDSPSGRILRVVPATR